MNWIFVSPYGIGDLFLLCSLSKAFLEKHGGKRIKIHAKSNYRPIQQLFPETVEIVPWKENEIVLEKQTRFENGRPFVAHPIYALSEKEGIDSLGAEGVTLLTLYRRLLFINENNSLLSPNVSSNSVDSAEKRAREMNLRKGRTVILAPECNSIPQFPEKIWKKWIKEIRSEGWDICVLSHSPKYQFEKIPSFSCPLDEMIPLAEWCGRVISIRSGVCDLLSSAKCQLTVLYPHLAYFSGTLFTTFSLKRMGISDRVEEKVFVDGRWMEGESSLNFKPYQTKDIRRSVLTHILMKFK